MFFLEVISTAFVVGVVLKTTKMHELPQYLKAVMIGAAYFIATSSTKVFSEAGNNFAIMFPKIILSEDYLMIVWFLLTNLLGLVLGMGLFSLLHKNKKRISKVMLDDKEVMDKEEELQEEKEREKDQLSRSQ